MDFQFINITNPEKKKLIEISRRLRKDWLILLIMSVSGAIYMAYTFWEGYTNYLIYIDAIFWIVLFLAFAVLAVLKPTIVTKRAMRTMRRKNLGRPVAMVHQFGDRIVSSVAGGVNTLDYCNIKRVYSLKTCYAIRFEHDMALLLVTRDGFTKGSFAEFKQFLRTKRPDLTIPE